MSKAVIQKFVEGKIIIREGEEVQNAYIIVHGFVQVFKRLSATQIVTIAKLGPGQLFGEMSLFADKKSTASVKALTNVELQVIDKRVFEEYLAQTPPLIKMLLEILANRLSKTSQKYLFVAPEEQSGSKFLKAPELDKIDFDRGKVIE